MTGRRILLWIVTLGVVLAVGAFAWAGRYGEIDPIAPPDPASFDRDLVDLGESLAAYGDCVVCHTGPDGQEYAGGLALPTPFGTLYTTNITPDPDTGIGTWSEEAFVRAMEHGVDREGGYLYPAFPYDRFTKVSTDDIRAIYAYLMAAVAPVNYEAPPNEMGFPFNIRLGMAGWNLLFLDRTKWAPDSDQDDEWNRGAYLVEGLGHCGSCHTPRNLLGAEKTGADAYGGGLAEGWVAPALNQDSTAPIPWTQLDLVFYLLDGWSERHGLAGGPMTPIVNHLYEQSEDDAFAIAKYVETIGGGPRSSEEMEAHIAEALTFAEPLEWDHPDSPAIPDDVEMQLGAAVFEDQCTDCHKSGGAPAPMALYSSVTAPDPTNVLVSVLDGIRPPRGALDRSMPGRDRQINDEEMVALLKFIRARFSNQPAWEGVEATVTDLRAGRHEEE